MLLNQSSRIEPTLVITFNFDDETTKIVRMEQSDIVTVIYNNKGNKVTISGKLTKIVPINNISRQYGAGLKYYIVVDGSSTMESNIATIQVDSILDVILEDESKMEIIGEKEDTQPEPEIPIEDNNKEEDSVVDNNESKDPINDNNESEVPVEDDNKEEDSIVDENTNIDTGIIEETNEDNKDSETTINTSSLVINDLTK